MSHFSPSHEPFVILYLVLHFLEVRKCEKSDKVWGSRALREYDSYATLCRFLYTDFEKKPTVLQSSPCQAAKKE